MGRTIRGGNRNHTPNVKPVQRVILSEQNTKQRFAAVIILMLIAGGAFFYALNGLMSNDSGWTNIEVSSAAETNCGDDFIFRYYLGAAGANATAEKKALTLLYTDALVKAYQNFHNDESFEGVTNVYDINRHPNETLTVEPILYQALELFYYTGRRELYFGPIYAEYQNLFFCNDDSETVNYDAYQSEEVADYFSEVVSYAGNPDMVNIELLGENQICLHVSDEYLAYAKENGISDYIDFSWLQNAFIIDYLADVMTSNGYTLGAITSYDGFTRNLDKSSGTEYSFNIYDRQETVIYPAAVMNYSGARSIVNLHDYPMSDKENYDYYQFRNGEIRTRYVDVKDGLCKSSVHNLTAYSDTQGCVQILFQILPVYVSDSLNVDTLKTLSSLEIESIYGEKSVLFYTDSSLNLTDFYDNNGVTYSAEQIK